MGGGGDDHLTALKGILGTRDTSLITGMWSKDSETDLKQFWSPLSLIFQSCIALEFQSKGCKTVHDMNRSEMLSK